MQFVMVIYEGAKEIEGRTTVKTDPYIAAWRAYYQEVLKAGAYVGGAPLAPASLATTVRVRDGAARVQDGPYAESKEQLGGFMILEAPNLDAALDWAKRCPAARYGAVEVRPHATETHEVIVG